MTLYVPGTEETDLKKVIMSLQQIAAALSSSTNDNAGAGNIGEIIEREILTGAAVSLTTGVQTNVISIDLPPGDWNVWATIAFLTGATTVVAASIGSISLTSATLATAPGKGTYFAISGDVHGVVFPVGMRRVSLAAPATVYLVADSIFTTSTQAAYGYLGARRAR